jgi:hypothetical protein
MCILHATGAPKGGQRTARKREMARNALKVKDSLRVGRDLHAFDALAWGAPRPAIGASRRRTQPHRVGESRVRDAAVNSPSDQSPIGVTVPKSPSHVE